MPADPARLIRILHQMAEAARQGDLGTLGPLAEEATAALAAPSARRPDSAELARLHRQARTTARLLAATAEGLRAARRRLREIAAARDGSGTYGPEGRRPAASPMPRDLVRRL